ncbi:MAG: CBS domain-containing protein [Vicinamibacterales bacterium]
MLPAESVRAYGTIIRSGDAARTWGPFAISDGVLLLKRDLLDQQIIDVHGRKVVRVNDVELYLNPTDTRTVLDVLSVDVGARGAVRRLAKGLVPSFTLRSLLEKIPPRVIPWQYVDLIETDPARRVKLKIAYEGLSKMHPADIADIVEDLPPAEQKAVFETLDEEVAAEALEEMDPEVQVSIVESLDKNRAADIVEEMDPDAAADLLGDLTEAHSGEILQEMEPEEREEVTQLLEFGEHTAAGRMTTEFIAVAESGTVADAVEALRQFEGSGEAVATIYLVGTGNILAGSVPLVRIAISPPDMRLRSLSEVPTQCAADTPEQQVAELFDKYNLITLPVTDAHGRLTGVVTADDVISMLRNG